MPITALDYEGIKQLQARFAHTLDFCDIAIFASCFAPDAVLTVQGERFQGLAAIAEYGRKTSAQNDGHVRHTIVVSTLIEGEGDTARSVGYGAFTRDYGPTVGKGQETKSRLLRSGVYEDSYIRIDGQWKFAARTYHKDGTHEVLRRFGQPLEIAHVDAGPINPTGLTALDCEAIRQLMTRYGYTLDFADLDGFTDTFMPDGYFELRTMGDPDFDGEARIEGAEALRGMCEFLGPRVKGHVRHGVINALIEGDGARANVSSYGFFTTDHGAPPRHTEPDSFMMETSGIYRDEVVKVDGIWRFSARSFRYDGWPDVVSQVGKPLELGLFTFAPK